MEKSTIINLIVTINVIFLSLQVAHSEDNNNTCIRSKFSINCSEDSDCYTYNEKHLYCNKTSGANICAFRIETYAGQAIADKDCPGIEYSSESWSNPIPDDILLDGSQGIDCMRWCYLTETCFGVTIQDNKCFLKNDLCFSNLKNVQGALLGVMSIVREDYHCGCHYPFTRRRKSGQILSWTPDCPESQLDRNPYRCCSEKGLCIKCALGELPPILPSRVNLSDLIGGSNDEPDKILLS